MPLYAFRCNACCYEFDRLLSLREKRDGLECPECGSPARRLVSAFATKGGQPSFDAPLAAPS